MKRTISAEVGKGSVNHNSRKFRAENVDGSRTDRNIDYCNERIQTVYHQLFDEALKRYNESKPEVTGVFRTTTRRFAPAIRRSPSTRSFCKSGTKKI